MRVINNESAIIPFVSQSHFIENMAWKQQCIYQFGDFTPLNRSDIGFRDVYNFMREVIKVYSGNPTQTINKIINLLNDGWNVKNVSQRKCLHMKNSMKIDFSLNHEERKCLHMHDSMRIDFSFNHEEMTFQEVD